ncbi:MAG: hypothetical protein WAQ22_04555 [Candidatus Saccharimonas sp.]
MKTINTPVSITAIGFGRGMEVFPRRMEWLGHTYDFIDRGIRVRGQKGSTITLSDGLQNFCLRHQQGQWLLLSVG